MTPADRRRIQFGMAAPSIRFELGDYHWVPEPRSVGFTGTTGSGVVEFLITSEALVALVNPGLETIGREMALEAFIEFEADIHRIARLEFVKRFGGEPPIILTAADVAI